MTLTRHLVVFITILYLLFFSSCKTRKIATGRTFIGKTDTTAFAGDASRIIQRANDNRIPYEWLTTRIKADYSDGQQSLDFTVVVRMRRDSVLWMSLQGPFGIEGARILVTRDSVRIINKLSNEYLNQPISYISSIAPIETDMAMLQDFIMGYYMQFAGAPPEYRGMEDSLYLMQAEAPKMRYRARLYPQNYTLAKSLLTDKMVKQEMSITFDGYTAEQGRPFSAERNIELKQGSKTYTLHLSYTKVKVNEPLIFPFDIDPGMKQVDRIRF
ncbi:MAG: hypothetical protein JWO03_64 [Bacteroidetes bacterium]|nr:hypothetical protein [Bacteroidota bacterium]